MEEFLQCNFIETIPRILIIPFIPFSDFPFRVLQIAF